jgi:riboflavin kinase/FMN adenylyltransferase
MDCMPPLPPPAVHARTSRWQPGSEAAIAVGNFDGVHVGHATIARRLRAAADRRGVPALALTFDPHPAAIVRPAAAPVPLTTPARRAALLLDLGLDAVLVQPADRGLLALDAEAFYAQILRGGLRAVALVEGADFRFGAGRAGDVGRLAGWAAADGVELEVVPPVVVGGTAVSSSRIRGLVTAGEIAAANVLLTAPLRLSGMVVSGARRGAGLGFPTANLAELATLVPGQGVYAGRVTIAPGAEVWPAAVHIGPNVSFGETAVSVEAHLVGFEGDLYGSTLHVDFLERLRETRRFASVAELTQQLTDDVQRAQAVSRQPANSLTPRSRHAT